MAALRAVGSSTSPGGRRTGSTAGRGGNQEFTKHLLCIGPFLIPLMRPILQMRKLSPLHSLHKPILGVSRLWAGSWGDSRKQSRHGPWVLQSDGGGGPHRKWSRMSQSESLSTAHHHSSQLWAPPRESWLRGYIPDTVDVCPPGPGCSATIMS